MLIKIVFGVIAAALLSAYLIPIVLKLKDVSLSVVVVLGLVLMIIDMLQSLRSKE